MVNASKVSENGYHASRVEPLNDCILAAIDIGTNSIHMVVVKINAQLPSFTIVAKEKDTVRLGDRDPDTGNLTAEAMARSIAALKRCQDLAVSLKADHILAVATSATREAPNGPEFLAQIEAELGIVVNLISGQEEARRIYLGVLSGLDFKEQPHIIIDIGGGSTELILADTHEARFLSSTKVGAVRLSQDFVRTDPISKQEFALLQAYIRGMLERPVDELNSYLKTGEKPVLVGTSGTIETLAMIHALETQGLEPSPLNSYQVKLKDLQSLLNRFVSMGYEQRFALPGMSDKRAEIIVAGTTILVEAMTMLEIDSITICERALREGVIVDWMLQHGYIENRLQYQGEVRSRSVLKIAHKYQVDLNYAQRVANFALSIFDRTKGQLHNWGDEERQLLWAAAMLHNCGLYISHAAHHKHSYYLIRNAELLGFSEIELEVMAHIARYHRKSKPKKKHESYSLLPHHYRQVIKQMSAILRIAIALDRRQIGAIKEIDCKYDSEYKQLHLYLVPSQPDDDCTLEMWNLDYKKPVFEQEYGVQVLATLQKESIKSLSFT
jgi:exopolyphosphatase/guanosine-5'-triphosphate,3'-diphosphate pyrophosphatase